MWFEPKKLAAVVALLLGGAVVAVALWPHREQLNRENLMSWLEALESMGPLAFFGLMSVAPLFWAPLTPFLLLAPAFGTGTAIVGTFLALALNMVLSWAVSGKWLRPVFEKLAARFGYPVPKVSAEGMVGMALMLRLTPGVPFPLQNYLLGLARMPLGKYLMVSLPIMWSISLGFILLGKSMMQGNWQLAMLAVALVVLVSFGLRTLRSRLWAKHLAEGALERDA